MGAGAGATVLIEASDTTSTFPGRSSAPAVTSLVSLNACAHNSAATGGSLVVATPEPGTLALMLAGLPAVALLSRRRKAAR